MRNSRYQPCQHLTSIWMSSPFKVAWSVFISRPKKSHRQTWTKRLNLSLPRCQIEAKTKNRLQLQKQQVSCRLWYKAPNKPGRKWVKAPQLKRLGLSNKFPTFSKWKKPMFGEKNERLFFCRLPQGYSTRWLVQPEKSRACPRSSTLRLVVWMNVDGRWPLVPWMRGIWQWQAHKANLSARVCNSSFRFPFCTRCSRSSKINMRKLCWKHGSPDGTFFLSEIHTWPCAGFFLSCEFRIKIHEDQEIVGHKYCTCVSYKNHWR